MMAQRKTNKNSMRKYVLTIRVTANVYGNSLIIVISYGKR
ncbi:hypothetical protein EVA_15936 [gut metagenome]|uniref:Uncharacterized protein n=1 Tax=gut metagenome TaxID=749906 RepID=J9C7W2_9ZZZZ